jgi:SAM-dependent methyltransferase
MCASSMKSLQLIDTMAPLFAFCNDCDFMTFDGYREVHGFLDTLGLPAGDSFWLFDPSGSEMALFTHDLDHKGPRHDELLAEIVAGRIDVLHSAGSYGAKFNRGYRPERRLIGGALDYLAKHGARPRIWSNHGDAFNTQNIGASRPAAHHLGDQPTSDTYVLDLLLDFGIEFYWIDHLLIDRADIAYRVVGTESTRAGPLINTFARFMGMPVSPNGKNLGLQLCAENLADIVRLKQATVLYQHWGCDHDTQQRAFTPPGGEVLGSASRASLAHLASLHASGEIHVCRLHDLLTQEKARPLGDDAQRVGAVVVMPDKSKPDNFYFNQYNKHSVGYFRERLAGMGVHGSAALDAGCGVGQWSFALADLGFTEVAGIDYSEQALSYLAQINARLRQHSPHFERASIEQLPFGDQRFDFVLSYGVIFCARVDVALREFFRVLRAGGSSYICLNADGWYQYLIDQRFRDSPLSTKRSYAFALWNAFFDRVGGTARFQSLRDDATVRAMMGIATSPLSPDASRQLLACVAAYSDPLTLRVMQSYSDVIAQLLGEFCRAAFERLAPQGGPTSPVPVAATTWPGIDALLRLLRRSAPPKTSMVQPSLVSDYLPFILPEGTTQGRAYQPEEFEMLARATGFGSFTWAPDAGLSRSPGGVPVRSIYAPDYRGMPAVWECLLHRSA